MCFHFRLQSSQHFTISSVSLNVWICPSVLISVWRFSKSQENFRILAMHEAQNRPLLNILFHISVNILCFKNLKTSFWQRVHRCKKCTDINLLILIESHFASLDYETSVDLWSDIITMDHPSPPFHCLLLALLLSRTVHFARWAHMRRFLSVVWTWPKFTRK